MHRTIYNNTKMAKRYLMALATITPPSQEPSTKLKDRLAKKAKLKLSKKEARNRQGPFGNQVN